MLAPGLVWMGTALWLLGMNPSRSQIPRALFPLGSAPDPVSNFPWCCPHLLRLHIRLLSRLSVLGHLPGLTA